MPIWIFRLFALLLLLAPAAQAEVIERLPTQAKLVALTFDACESRTPAFLDTAISNVLVERKIPFTIFVTGRFARHNAEALSALAKQDFVEIENHAMNHDNHMDRMDGPAIRREVSEAEDLLASITGRKTRYFRFPAGNTNPRATAEVEAMGYKVVHWTFPSGDPARSLTAEALTNWVLTKTKPGNILIFHINGRGWSTGAALPGLLDGLTRQGYGFTRLDSVLQ